MDMDEVIARAEIMDILHRYCRGVDRGDVALLKSVYHQGAIDYHGPFEADGATFAESIVSTMDAVPIIGQHHITNAVIVIDGDTARSESYFLAFHPDVDPASVPFLAMIGGRYLDRLTRINGRWGITERRVIMDWSREPIAGQVRPGTANYLNGARHEADASHGFLD